MPHGIKAPHIFVAHRHRDRAGTIWCVTTCWPKPHDTPA